MIREIVLKTVTIMKIIIITNLKVSENRTDIRKAPPKGVKIAEMKFTSRFPEFIHK